MLTTLYGDRCGDCIYFPGNGEKCPFRASVNHPKDTEYHITPVYALDYGYSHCMWFNNGVKKMINEWLKGRTHMGNEVYCPYDREHNSVVIGLMFYGDIPKKEQIVGEFVEKQDGTITITLYKKE
jgi:hypothetical protein